MSSPDRPEVALITNHGYGGARIPVGGAPDTGGQNMYVNALALALERAGYDVTVFARGGFPYFAEERIRDASEKLSDHVRYVFVPGGGDDFLRKEDIATALDEQVEWLDRFVREEAAEQGCEPWERYELINTHYWDAAVLGLRLVERWRNDLAHRAIASVAEGAVDAAALEDLHERRHRKALGEAPGFQLGAFLLTQAETPSAPTDDLAYRAIARLREAGRIDAVDADRLRSDVETAIRGRAIGAAPELARVRATKALGLGLLGPEAVEDLERVDRHVWTPHSLGELKDENFRDHPFDVRRDLKFCERRSHERMICSRTRAFAVTSGEIAERLVTHYRVPTERIFYFPPCIDRRAFRPREPNETEATYRYLAERSGVDESKLRSMKVVFETSRMDRTKRKDLLLEAFARIAPDCSDAFLVIGGGPENEIFEQLDRRVRSDPGLRDRVLLTGFIPDEVLAPLFSVATVYASASEMEGFGMSVSQAAAARTAILTTDLVPFSLQYVPDDAAIAPAGDVERFAEELRGLLRDDAGRERRAAALEQTAKKLDWLVQTHAFLDYLRSSGMPIARGSEQTP